MWLGIAQCTPEVGTGASCLSEEQKCIVGDQAGPLATGRVWDRCEQEGQSLFVSSLRQGDTEGSMAAHTVLRNFTGRVCPARVPTGVGTLTLSLGPSASADRGVSLEP